MKGVNVDMNIYQKIVLEILKFLKRWIMMKSLKRLVLILQQENI